MKWRIRDTKTGAWIRDDLISESTLVFRERLATTFTSLQSARVSVLRACNVAKQSNYRISLRVERI